MAIVGNYVLITPTKDEENLIGVTIESVVNQTVLPLEWVIVSDGSTDGTECIVRAAMLKHSWIRLVSLPKRNYRSFSSVVHATEAGIQALTNKDYEYLGLLDSDLKFSPPHFEILIAEFNYSPRLGLAGPAVFDPGEAKTRLPRNRLDVPGACQFFRRNCFEALGGLLAIPEGGWDALTCARARMLSYETRLVVGLAVDHLKPRSSAEGGLLLRQWKLGFRDHALGAHAMFELCKCISRTLERPLIVGTVIRLAGFLYASASRRKRNIPTELMNFIRREQAERLQCLVMLRRRKQ